MKREEAIKKFMEVSVQTDYCYGNYAVYCEDVREIVNKIYDDFESRVCKNCKYFNKVGLAGYSCSNKKNKNMHSGESIIWVDKEFGCNRFERIENEGD